MRHVAVIAITALVAAAAFTAPDARASSPLVDCAKHQQLLVESHSERSLRSTFKRQKAGAEHVGDCGRAVSSQLAGLRRDKSNALPRAIERDCLHHGGALTKAYTEASLRKAFRTLTTALRVGTRCEVGIASQYNAVRGSRTPLRRSSPPRRSAPTRDLPGALQLLSAHFTVFARPVAPADTPPGTVQDLVAFENKDPVRADAPIAIDQGRRIGPSARMFAFPAPGELCTGLAINREATVISCVQTADLAGTIQAPVTRTPGGVTLWGPVPDDVHDVRVLDRAGHWRSVPIQANGLTYTLAKVPQLMTWQDGKDVTHYADYTASICLPGTPCPQPPDEVARRSPATS